MRISGTTGRVLWGYSSMSAESSTDSSWLAANGRVVVVGAGFLGLAVAEDVARSGVPHTLIHRSPLAPPARLWDSDCRLVHGDASDPRVVAAAVRDGAHVIWCAGGPMPAEAQRRSSASIEATVGPVSSFLHHLAGTDVEGFTYVSSGGTVYGGQLDGAISEDAPLRPTTAYGRAHVAAEDVVRRQCAALGIRPLILRGGNVYGPGQPGNRSQGVIAAALQAVRTRQVLTLFGNGEAVRDFLYVDDFVDAVAALACRSFPWDACNVGSGRGVSVNEVIAVVEAVTGTQLRVERVPARPCDVSRVVLDPARLRTVLAREPRSLESGVTATWARLDGPAQAVGA